MNRKDLLEKFITEFIETPSLSGRERDLAEKIREKLREMGLDKVMIDRYGNVVAEVKGKSEAKILFEGHLDHVPPGNIKAWKYPPYKAKIIDEKVYGRGTVDMKGPISSIITAISEISKRELNVNIQLAFVVHEETIEGEAIKRIIEEGVLEKPNIAILIEPTNLNIAIGHRGRSLIKTELHGKTAHASMPKLGINTIETASKYISEVMKIRENLPEHKILGKASITPIKIRCKPEGLPQLPDRSQIIFDRRTIIGENEEDVLNPLKEIVNKLVKMGEAVNGNVEIMKEKLKCWTGSYMKVKDFFPAWITPIERLEELKINEFVRNLNKDYIIWDFSTDGVYIANIGITTFGFGPGDWKLAHQPNETINLKDMERAVEGYIMIIKILEEKLCKNS